MAPARHDPGGTRETRFRIAEAGQRCRRRLGLGAGHGVAACGSSGSGGSGYREQRTAGTTSGPTTSAATAPSGPTPPASRPRAARHLRPRGRDDRWLVPPRGAARDRAASRSPVRSTTRSPCPTTTATYVPFLAESVTPNRQQHGVDDQLRPGIKFHDGTAAQRAGRQGQPRRVPRQVPGPEAAAVHVRVRPTSATSRSSTRMTVEVDMKTPWVGVPVRSSTSTAASASWRRSQLDDAQDCNKRADRHRSVRVKELDRSNDQFTVGEEPELLAQGRERRASCRTSTRSRSSRIEDGAQRLNGVSSKPVDFS